ncbi:hypothetical protein [Deinococcus hohokamensis]|uniref:Uncharacterized protein n=1 Tax=Deinococcus hohokamensis TaxID=309883 RepID=A0ABV9IAQ0_9DEIO
MRTRPFGLTVLTAASMLGSCAQTPDVAARDAASRTLAAQGEKSSFTFSRTEPFDFISPCNGERVSGIASFSGQGQRLTDATGVVHIHSNFTYSGTYTGGRTGMAYTEFSQGQFHLNDLRGDGVNSVRILNGKVKASDGSTIMIKERTVFVVSQGGEVRVDRFPTEATALSCRGAERLPGDHRHRSPESTTHRVSQRAAQSFLSSSFFPLSSPCVVEPFVRDSRV